MPLGVTPTYATLAPHDRVISIEDTTELQCAVKNYFDLRAVGNVTMLGAQPFARGSCYFVERDTASGSPRQRCLRIVRSMPLEDVVNSVDVLFLGGFSWERS
jgi:hypothetical protein